MAQFEMRASWGGGVAIRGLTTSWFSRPHSNRWELRPSTTALCGQRGHRTSAILLLAASAGSKRRAGERRDADTDGRHVESGFVAEESRRQAGVGKAGGREQEDGSGRGSARAQKRRPCSIGSLPLLGDGARG